MKCFVPLYLIFVCQTIKLSFKSFGYTEPIKVPEIEIKYFSIVGKQHLVLTRRFEQLNCKLTEISIGCDFQTFNTLLSTVTEDGRALPVSPQLFRSYLNICSDELHQLLSKTKILNYDNSNLKISMNYFEFQKKSAQSNSKYMQVIFGLGRDVKLSALRPEQSLSLEISLPYDLTAQFA